MKPQRVVLGWILGGLAATAGAQADQALRWRTGGMTGQGLRPSQLELRIGEVQPNAIDRLLGRTGSPGLDLRWQPASGEPADLGVYGRFGTFSATPLPALGPGSGLTYGVGLRWDFSAGASAILGWDSYDMRTANGERDVRATSLGLQLRY